MLSCKLSWGSFLGKELKYISISTTAYILIGNGLCAGIKIYLGTHVHAIDSIWFSPRGRAVRTRTEDHRHVRVTYALRYVSTSIVTML